MFQTHDDDSTMDEGGNQSKVEEGLELAVRDAKKKQATRKKLFKPAITTAGSNKMRIASALVSPHKRAPPKPISRQEITPNKQRVRLHHSRNLVP